MSTRQRLSLIGLYNYENSFGRDLFDKLELPEGYERSTFVNSLLLEHGEKCVLYTDPTFFTLAIGVWSKKWALELSRIYEALTAEYNPIYNYDRYEESVDGRKKDYNSDVQAGARLGSESATMGSSKNESHTNAISATGSERTEDQNGERRAKDKPNYEEKTTNDYDVTTSQTTSGSVEHEVSADNASTYQPDWKETTNGGTSKQENDGTITKDVSGIAQDLEEVSKNKNSVTESSKAQDVSGATSETSENGKSRTSAEELRTTNTKDQEREDNEHRAHLFGNIGVTTSAAMVSEVVQQRMNANLYDIATGIFARELLLGIY